MIVFFIRSCDCVLYTFLWLFSLYVRMIVFIMLLYDRVRFMFIWMFSLYVHMTVFIFLLYIGYAPLILVVLNTILHFIHMYSFVIIIVHCLLATLLCIIKVYCFDKPPNNHLVYVDQVLFAYWPRFFVSYHRFSLLSVSITVEYYMVHWLLFVATTTRRIFPQMIPVQVSFVIPCSVNTAFNFGVSFNLSLSLSWTLGKYC